MGFIHSRNVCQKEVITFNRLWEECTQEESRLITREEKMGATEDQALTIQRRSLKRWGIWRTRFLKNLLSILKKWCCYKWRRWWSWRIKKDSTHETNKDKYSIVISWYFLVIHFFIIIFNWCLSILHSYYWIVHNG